MKKLLILPLFALLMTACGPTDEDAVKLNDMLVSKLDRCTKAEEQFFTVLEGDDPKAMINARKTFSDTCRKIKTEIEKVETHKDLSKLKEAALRMINFSTSIAEKDYAEYVALLNLSDDKFTENEQKRAAEILKSIDTRGNEEYNTLEAVQKEFGKKYNFELYQSK